MSYRDTYNKSLSKDTFYTRTPDGRYFVPNMDQVGGFNPDRPMVDDNGNLVVGENGNLVAAGAPQTPQTFSDGKGAWSFVGQGATQGNYDGVPGTYYASGAPQWFQSAPDESFLSSFMQGPGFVLGSALGANALFGGGLGGLSGLFNGGGSLLAPGESALAGSGVWSGGNFLSGAAGAANGGGMSWLDSLSNFFGGGTPDLSNVLWDQAPGGLGQAVTGGGGDAMFDLSNLGAASGGTIPATQWGTSGLGGLSSILNNANTARSLFNGLSSSGLLGGALGALAGGIGANSKPAGTVTSIQDIPDYLKPYQSMNLTSGANNFAAAGAGASLLPGAQSYLQNTINGQYLDPNQNPAFQPYVKDLMGQAGANYASLYGKNPDALNNSGFQEGYTRAITNAALPLYNSAFQTAQGNQFNAAQNAPGFANNVAGAAFAPNLAFKNLYTGPQATTNPYFTSPLGGALSGGLAGYTLGNSIFGGK
jgi:hypothetical protein